MVVVDSTDSRIHTLGHARVIAVNLCENMRVSSHENSIKASDKCSSTLTTNEAGTLNKDGTNKVVKARVSYADAVRTPSCAEIVRGRLNLDFAKPESQALSKTSGKRSTRTESQALSRLSGKGSNELTKI